jgi:hypothetical protein
VDTTLTDPAEGLKESVIAVSVYGRVRDTIPKSIQRCESMWAG